MSLNKNQSLKKMVETEDNNIQLDNKIIEVTEKEETKESIVKTAKDEENNARKSLPKSQNTSISNKDLTTNKPKELIDKKKSISNTQQTKQKISIDKNIKKAEVSKSKEFKRASTKEPIPVKQKPIKPLNNQTKVQKKAKKAKAMSKSESGSSINSVKNKSNLENLCK